MAVFFGYNAPFFGGPQNILSRQEDARLIKNDILQIILTEPGERVMRPAFGVPLRSFVFHTASDYDLQNLESQIITAINTWEPRVNIAQVTITRAEPHGINIHIVVAMKNDPQNQLVIDQFIAGN